MAATSKQTDSSYFPSSSSSKLWDVFLSFGGKDTRRGFIGHLYSALVQAGIRTFKDEPGLERGEEIAPQLIKAIHDSKMSIVVFSENYASSKWCLTELAEILECQRTEGHTVLPVFYDVDPSNVRHQIKSYAEAFEKHKIRYAEKAETWRDALTTTANISGYDLKNYANGYEADLIQKIVKDSLMKFCPKDLNVTGHQVGIDSRVKEICQKLSIGSNDVRFIGIYGMPGIGKTTIVKALYNKIYNEFEGSCFLGNVTETFKQYRGLHYLLKQLISELLNIKDFKVTSNDTGISFLKQRLRSKKFLIVLDDLDEIEQLESLAGNWNWFGPGSRIIFTTRDSRLLDQFQVDLRHEVEELDHNESLELFRRHAFRNTTPMKNLIELSKDIVRYAGGLPLALELLGSSLFNRDMVQWESFFGKLKKIPHKDIQKKLRISYDALNDDKVQGIFLDIACFFIGMDKDDVSKILDACDFSPEIEIKNLRERCLLKIDRSNRLCMHNLIRDMGREIVREESVKNPRMRSRLWFHEDAYDVLKKFKGHENIEGIRLVMPMQEKVDISTEAFLSLPNLRLLQISNVNLTGSFENLFEELRWFCWYDCPLECLPSNFQAPNLVFLDMQNSKLEILWKGTEQLQSLKILNVSDSRSLKTTPDFKGLKLEKLILHGCSSLSVIHPSIGLLKTLVELDLYGCDSLNQLPEQLGNMGCLRKIDASHSSVVQLPDSIGRLHKLEKLKLGYCKKLRNLPSSICDLTSLTDLDLDYCSNLESLPENLGNLTSLPSLGVTGCSSLRSLPELPPYLKKLDARYCTSLDKLPNLSKMNNLITLSFTKCSSLQSLPEPPPNLEYLGSEECRSIQFLPTLPRLRRLRLDNCTSLQSLPNFFSEFSTYNGLELKNLSSLQSIEEIQSDLVELKLTNCSSLESLPNLPCNLRSVKLTGSSNLRSLPNFHFHSNIRNLDLTDCNSLESLQELPPFLHELYLNNNTSLKSLPSNLNQFVKLEELHLSNCNKLLSLPKLPPILKDLRLINCTSLQSLPKLPSTLWRLDLTGCSNLRSLPKFISNLGFHSNLGHLDLSECSSLESLQELPCHLYYLNASGCTSLQQLPDLSNLTKLYNLILTDCTSNLISNFIWSFLQDCSGFDDCKVYLPSREIPDRFRHQTMGSSISFQIPLEVKSNFLRMALWVVFREGFFHGLQAVIANKTDGTQFNYSVPPVRISTGAHSWLTFMEKPISMKSGDTIEVSFRVPFEDVTVKKCGVHFDCKRVRDVDVDVDDVEPLLCSFKRMKLSA